MIPLLVFDQSGTQHAISALVDTGFTGWLTLPANLIASLGLRWCREGQGVLADGGLTLFNVFAADVVWDGQRKLVFVSELDGDPLIGMSLLNGFRFVMDAIDGGPIRIERLP